VRTGNPILFMDIASAEITKYAANAMLATRISFMNMIAGLCEAVGADVSLVRQGIGTDERIGPSFLFAGIGYGGSCFPKDVKALVHTLSACGVDAGDPGRGGAVNEAQKQLLLERVVERYGEDLTGRGFAVWGLSFKPETDDMREAPSLTVVRGLASAAPGWWRTTRRRGHEAERHFADLLDRASSDALRARTTTAWRAPTRCWCSPSGSRTGGRTSSGSGRCSSRCLRRPEPLGAGEDAGAGLPLRAIGRPPSTPLRVGDAAARWRLTAPMRVLITGAAGFLGSTSATASSRRGTRWSGWTTSSPAARTTSRT
jgi:hypothetical protein